MAKILINGVKANAGGGKVIINNYLALLKSGAGKHKFVVLTPDREEYLQYACDSIEIVDVKNLYKKNILFPLLYYWDFPKLLEKLHLETIKKAYSNIEERALKIKEGDNKIKQLLSWKQVFECYQNLLELNIRKLKKAT